MDLQFLAVMGIVILAAAYAGWRFLRQFFHADDEAAACARCPAAQGTPFTLDEPPAPPSASPPASAPRE